MKHERISIRYAKAFFELADEMKLMERAFQDMRLIEQVCSVKEFAVTMNSPVIKQLKKIAIVKALFAGKVHELTLNYLIIIIKQKRENLIDGIASQFISMYHQKAGIKIAYLKSAEAFDQKMQDTIVNTLKTQLNSDIELIATVNPELIGGFIVSVDGKRYDASIRGKLDKLTKQFKVNIYEKGF